jgi:hypothetical protein
MTIRIALVAAAFAATALPARASAQIAVLSSTVEERVASPGSRYTGDIVISNPTREAQAVRIYQTDYRFLADGTSRFDDAGTSTRSNARWIAPQATRVTVPAGARITVPYAVSVPADTTLRGTYWSAVMVEGVTDPLVGASQQLAVGSVMRYAIQVATHIDASGERDVRFESPSAGLTPAGSAMLDLDVLNTGERGVRPGLSVEVYDADGKLRARARQQRGLLYPGTSLHQRFDLGALPAGTYKAIVFADTGAEPVLATQYTITW